MILRTYVKFDTNQLILGLEVSANKCGKSICGASEMTVCAGGNIEFEEEREEAKANDRSVIKSQKVDTQGQGRGGGDFRWPSKPRPIKSDTMRLYGPSGRCCFHQRSAPSLTCNGLLCYRPYNYIPPPIKYNSRLPNPQTTRFVQWATFLMRLMIKVISYFITIF